MKQVAIGTLGNAVEGDIVTAMLRSNGIRCTVSGQHHAALLGGLAGPAITLVVRVAQPDAERARELIEAWRQGNAVDEAELEQEALAAGSGPASDGQAMVAAVSSSLSVAQHRRKRAVAALAAVTVSFGVGHLIAKAYLRAIALMGWTLMAFKYIWADQFGIGGGMLAIGMIADLVGSQVLLASETPIAEARVVASKAP